MQRMCASDTLIHTSSSLSLCLSNALSTSFLFGVSGGLNLLSAKTHTHTHTTRALRGRVDLLAGRMRLDFQYGFVLQHSVRSIPPPVSVNVIRLLRLLPVCSLYSFLFFVLSRFHFFTFHPARCPLYSAWLSTLLALLSAHLCGVLIHFLKCSLHGRPLPMFLI